MLIQQDLFFVAGHVDLPALLGFDVLGKAVGAVDFAVDDEEPTRRALQGREPFGKLVFVGVSGKACYLDNLGFDGIVSAENSHLFGALNDMSSQSTNGLVADKEDSVFGVGDIVD